MAMLGVIGVGNMATAILFGILRSEALKPEEIVLYDHHIEKIRPFLELGAKQADGEAEVMQQADQILLAVKPQAAEALWKNIRPFCRMEHLFISIMAGLSADALRAGLGYDAKVVLAMPNTPLMLAKGTTALAQVAPTTDAEFAVVKEYFAASGTVVAVESNRLNEVIPLNGSSPAFLYHIAQIFVEDAVQRGFCYEDALTLFATTMIGSAEMMLNSKTELASLIQMVCSKGGTTIAGLDAMDRAGLPGALQAGINACVNRAYELGK